MQQTAIMRCKATFGLLSLLRHVNRLPLIFDAGTFTCTSLSLRSHVLRRDQHEVLPRLRMGKSTVEDLANRMTNAITTGSHSWHAIKNGSHREETVKSQFRRCNLWLQQATPSEPCNHGHKAHQQTRGLEIECHGAITRGQE